MPRRWPQGGRGCLLPRFCGQGLRTARHRERAGNPSTGRLRARGRRACRAANPGQGKRIDDGDGRGLQRADCAQPGEARGRGDCQTRRGAGGKRGARGQCARRCRQRAQLACAHRLHHHEHVRAQCAGGRRQLRQGAGGEAHRNRLGRGTPVLPRRNGAGLPALRQLRDRRDGHEPLLSFKRRDSASFPSARGRGLCKLRQRLLQLCRAQRPAATEKGGRQLGGARARAFRAGERGNGRDARAGDRCQREYRHGGGAGAPQHGDQRLRRAALGRRCGHKRRG